jgi:hypothetical protein
MVILMGSLRYREFNAPFGADVSARVFSLRDDVDHYVVEVTVGNRSVRGLIDCGLVNDVVFEPLSRLRWRYVEEPSDVVHIDDGTAWDFSFAYGGRSLYVGGHSRFPDRYRDVTVGLLHALLCVIFARAFNGHVTDSCWWDDWRRDCRRASPYAWHEFGDSRGRFMLRLVKGAVLSIYDDLVKRIRTGRHRAFGADAVR